MTQNIKGLIWDRSHLNVLQPGSRAGISHLVKVTLVLGGYPEEGQNEKVAVQGELRYRGNSCNLSSTTFKET